MTGSLESRRIRVLQVIPSIGPLRGGPSVMMRTIVRGLAQADVDVHVATTDDDGPGRMKVPLGVPVVDETVTYWYFPRQTRFYGFSWPLGRWLARHVREYDVAHIHALFSYAALPAARAARRAGVPYVVRPLGTLNRWGMERRHPRLKRLSLRLVERRILEGAARIHYTSEQERIEAGMHGIGVDGRGIVLPLGVDARLFEDPPSRGWLRMRAPHLGGRTVVLFLSRLDTKKGLDLLLQAFARVRGAGQDAALVVAGTGVAAFEAGLRREAARLGIDGDTHWAGFLSGPDKLAALADSDLFVLPSYSENFGISVVEAMAAGLPVLISDQVGIHRDVTGADAGLVVPAEVEALAAGMRRLIADRPLRVRLGDRGRRLAGERFSVDSMTASLVGMYHAILGRAPRAGFSATGAQTAIASTSAEAFGVSR